jgi:hypothetical protein
MRNITIGTCVRHGPPLPHQQFIGSGVIFDLNGLGIACSIVLLDGRIIADLPLATLFDGSWVISERTMTPRQVHHLLAHAREWEEWLQNKSRRAGAELSGPRSSFADAPPPPHPPQRTYLPASNPDYRQSGGTDGGTQSREVAGMPIEVA